MGSIKQVKGAKAARKIPTRLLWPLLPEPTTAVKPERPLKACVEVMHC